MVSSEIKNIVESIIFASEDEISSRHIKEIIDKSGLRISIAEVEKSVESLNEEYRTSNKSFEILKISGGFSFATKKEYGRFIGKLFEDKQRKKLSASALETLAIIAYKQPITRTGMEFIRGVNVDYIVNSLMEKELITVMGRAESPGRPILYGTTSNFLKVLGLNALEDLPKLKEINEILKDQEIEGITQADIDLFNSFNDNAPGKETDTGHQLELISSNDSEESNDNTSESDNINDSITTDVIEIEDYIDENDTGNNYEDSDSESEEFNKDSINENTDPDPASGSEENETGI